MKIPSLLLLTIVELIYNHTNISKTIKKLSKNNPKKIPMLTRRLLVHQLINVFFFFLHLELSYI